MSRPRELSARRFVLTGEVGRGYRRFLLKPGPNRIGSLPPNELVLDCHGVSKRHAILVIQPDRVSVEDLASKNGTFVNGSRVESVAVTVGDVLRFGTVALRLDETNPLEGELAITLDEPEAGGRPAIGRNDTSPLAPTPGLAPAERWLRLVDAFVAELEAEPEGRVASALALVAAELGARGVSLMELHDSHEPTVTACCGEFEAAAASRVGWPRGGARPGIRRLAPGDGDGLPLTLALGPRAGARTPALAIWGEVAEEAAIEPLLSTLLRLCARFRPRRAGGRSEAVARAYPDLVFPRGYLRCESPPMVALYRQMAAVARSDVPVLVLGETGVGKEAIAQILHRSSDRREGPFAAINCAAIPAELLEAELFGIGQGVATGVAERKGRFELAEGGTLFLDEIGDMSKELQAKLLRALQDKEIQPVGGAPRPIRAGIVAATNTRLSRRIEAGEFRADLYYRLAGFEFTVPPLRERRQDVPMLVEHFLRRGACEAGKTIPGMTVGALRQLVERPWPGNVRQLAHEVLRLVYLCPDRQAIDSSLLTASAAPPAPDPPVPAEDAGAGAPEGAAAARRGGLEFGAVESLELAEIERQALLEALRRTRGNRTRAARLLGISREALRRRLARLGIDPPPREPRTR